MTMSAENKKVSDRPCIPLQSSPSGQAVRRLRVAELLVDDREVILEHGGQDYRLRITANGKLILTK